MKTISIPYYKGTLDLNIEEKNLAHVLTSSLEEFVPGLSEKELIKEALENPVGTKKLSEIAAGKKSCMLITSDHTRAMPSKKTLPILLDELRRGNKDLDITIMIATGLHRKTTRDEMINMFGKEIVNNEKIMVHDAYKDEDMVYVCTLPSGSEFSVNKKALEAHMIVTEGFIEPHFFAGFSGGRKSILPGISSAKTVNQNHSALAIDNLKAATGVLSGNPIHEDMAYAVSKVKVDFCLNVAMNAKKEIIGAFAGDIIKAHLKGCDFVNNLSGAKRVASDIVITSNGGYPLDQNLYQAPKGMSTGAACAGEDGLIIMVASCCDGVGGENFGTLMSKGTPEEITEKIMAIPPEKTISEQWCAQILCKILLKHKVILVTHHFDHEKVKELNLIPANTPDEALEIAYSLKGNDAKVTVIPDGVAVIIKD